MNIYIWGITWEDGSWGDGVSAEDAARAECKEAFDTDENCLVVDTAGYVLLNTTSNLINHTFAS